MKLKLLLLSFALGLSACGSMLATSDKMTVVDSKSLASFTGQAVHAAGNYVYVGAMLNGKREGYGVSYFKNGLVQAGQWKNDQLDGDAVVISPDVGSVSAGRYTNDQQSGPGVVILDGEVVQGEFSAGKAVPVAPQCYRNGNQIDCSQSGLL